MRVTYTAGCTAPDHEGNSERVLTLEHAADYHPYGSILREWRNGEAEKYLTTHHERDTETGLDYRGARYYDSDVARFLSLDPAQAEYPAWSAYNYVLGNPISLIDPDGRRAGKTYDSETGLMIHDDGIDDHKVYLGTKSDGSDRRYIGQEEDFHDVTDLFTQTLNKTTQAFLDKRVEISETRNGRYDETEKLEFFNANVRPGGTYDIKNNPASPFYKGLKGETNEGIYFHGRAFFEGNLFRYDDFGNMNYGAAGRAMFGRGSEDFLKQAAGLAQLKECVMGRSPCYPKSSNYDEPRDQLFISVGYHMGNILLTGNP